MKKYKLLVVIAVIIASVAGISFRLWNAAQDRDHLSKIYPRLEQLVAVYSLLAWKHAGQAELWITEDSEWGGQTFSLNCPTSINTENSSGALFNCFIETTTWTNPFDGERLKRPYVTTNEDFWYKFSCESLFGYELTVEVNPEGADYDYRDSLALDDRCAEEAGEGLCSFNVFAIELSGLQASGSITFYVADGFPVALSNGTYDRFDEWVVYFGQDQFNDQAITVGALNKLIQIVFRQLQIVDTDIEKALPMLESLWFSRDNRFLDSLFGELANTPDLIEISDFLWK